MFISALSPSRTPFAGVDGPQECLFAQNCVQAARATPLTEAISDVTREVIVQQLKDLVRA